MIVWVFHHKIQLSQSGPEWHEEQLRNENRDSYTRLFEDYAEEALAECEHYFKIAKKSPPRSRSMSNSQSHEGCWVLGKRKQPPEITFFGVEDYLYRFVALVLSATLPYDREVVRHRCHNNLCFRPDHLQIGTPAENKADNDERKYAGREAGGG